MCAGVGIGRRAREGKKGEGVEEEEEAHPVLNISMRWIRRLRRVGMETIRRRFLLAGAEAVPSPLGCGANASLGNLSRSTVIVQCQGFCVTSSLHPFIHWGERDSI